MIIGLIIIILLEMLIIFILSGNKKEKVKEPTKKELIETIEIKVLKSLIDNTCTETQLKILSQINDLKKD